MAPLNEPWSSSAGQISRFHVRPPGPPHSPWNGSFFTSTLLFFASLMAAGVSAVMGMDCGFKNGQANECKRPLSVPSYQAVPGDSLTHRPRLLPAGERGVTTPAQIFTQTPESSPALRLSSGPLWPLSFFFFSLCNICFFARSREEVGFAFVHRRRRAYFLVFIVFLRGRGFSDRRV